MNSDIPSTIYIPVSFPPLRRTFTEPPPASPLAPASLQNGPELRCQYETRRWSTTGSSTSTVNVCSLPPSLPQRSPEVRRNVSPTSLIALASIASSTSNPYLRRHKPVDAANLGPPKLPMRARAHSCPSGKWSATWMWHQHYALYGWQFWMHPLY